MKSYQKRLALFLLVLLLLPLGWSSANAESRYSANAACVLEVKTGRVLYEKNADAPMPMASTTKVLTAIIAIESGQLESIVACPDAASGVEGSSLYLKPGEQFTLLDLVYGLMLHSGNDAAEAIAIHLAGSVDGFCALMNEKARTIGCENSNFQNPHGLPSDNHYTTARDLAKISAYAMQNITFRQVVGTQYHEMYPQGEGEKRTLKNKNKLLWNYENATGIKTGFTKEAGRCLVAASQTDSLDVVAVVLSSPDMWNDTMELMDEAHATYWMTQQCEENQSLGTIPVEKGRTTQVELSLADACYFPLRIDGTEEVTVDVEKPASLTAPFEKGMVVGKATYSFAGTPIATIDVVTVEGVEKQTLWQKVKRFFGGT
ncbi:D-alanyl-D-alanine carboxypeptidase [Eubacteriales bacterium OttesenSCG-928-M02]|nr:D-alanyl-D-alanine carboxypeptidase [Eubacteriales bacterium OttesenSCG-928-M02]